MPTLSRPELTPTLNWRKKLFFASVTLLALLGLLELSARAFEWYRSGRTRPALENALRDRFHPLRYEFVPGSSWQANGAEARMNWAGLRDADPDRPKRRVRMLCLGDSCTFGYAPDVSDAATYPAVLGRLLDPETFEVLNAGMPGFGSLDCLNLFLYKAVELEPDYVVILVGWNDYDTAQPLAPPPGTSNPGSGWLDQLALFRLERALVQRLFSTRHASLAQERARLERLPAPRDQLSDPVFARTKRVIGALVRACRAQGAVPILATYASFTRAEWSDADSLEPGELRPALPYLLKGILSPRGWHIYSTTTNRLIREVATELDVPLVAGDALRDPALFADLCHLNARGCDAYARQVAPIVLQTHRENLVSP